MGAGGTVRWNSGTLMVEQCGTVEQSWWNSVVEQWNSHGSTVSWNSGTDHSGTVMVEQSNNDGGTVEEWNSRTVMVEQ